MATIDELVTAAEKEYIPGVNYTNYFKTAIAAAHRAGQENEVRVLSRLRDSWNTWKNRNTISSYSGTMNKAEAKKLADAAQATLDNQTKAINDVNSALDADLKAAKTKAQRNAILAGYSAKLMDAVYKAEDEATTASKTFAAGPTGASTPTTNAQAAYDEWKKTGLDPNITDPKVLAEYQALKLKDQGVTNVTSSGDKGQGGTNVTSSGAKGPVYSSALNSVPDALKEYGSKGLLPNKALNAPLYNELLNRIAAGTNAASIGEGPDALAKYLAGKPQGVKVDLPADYAARSAVQDTMLANAKANPGMYATGQFDPFYSGVASTSLQQQAPANVMNAHGVFEKGVFTAAPNTYGYGYQNAYVPPESTVGAAAGGYMDAQSAAQGNQQLQQQNPNSYSLGLGAIPNMTEYTNYGNNPGIATPTQNADDGSVGGVPVPGQTNPVW